MTTTTLPLITERVAAGAALLDEREPYWIERIAIHQLQLADCHWCVLGQLFGDYLNGFNDDALGEFDPLPFGFAGYAEAAEAESDDDETNHDAAIEAEYAELNAAWRELIETRRAER